MTLPLEDFRVADQASRKIITIKRVTVEEFGQVLEELSNLVSGSASITLHNYYSFLVKKLIPEYKKLLRTIDEEDKSGYITILYEYITAIYPRLAVEFVCKVINLNIINQLVKDENAANIVNSNVVKEPSLSSLEDVKKIETYLNQN